MADSDGLSNFPIEYIPDSDSLYLRIHRRHVDDEGQPMFVAFKDHAPSTGGRAGLSTDWCRYAEPQQTQAGGRQTPENYGVVEMVVGGVRSIEGLTVEHAPIKNHPELKDNRAHTEIYGDKTGNRTRIALLRECRWAIRLDAPKR